MSSVLSILLGCVGLAILTYGADFLVRGGVRLAEALRIPSVVIGLTLVSFATSAPELVVSIQSAIHGAGDISLGNVIGSNICNIALILGLSALIMPMKVNRRMLRFDTPILFVATALLTLFCLLYRGVNRWQALILLALFALFLGKNLRDAFAGKEVDMEELPKSARPLPIWAALLFVVGGCVALALGAKWFVDGAVCIARLCHVSDAVIGLTIVSVGTSLPELATSAVAAFRGEDDIAVGNVVGSNIFNILAILGIAPLFRPVQAVAIQTADLAVMGGVTLLMIAMMLFAGKKNAIRRWEGALLLAIYIGYIAWLVVQA